MKDLLDMKGLETKPNLLVSGDLSSFVEIRGGFKPMPLFIPKSVSLLYW